MSITPSDEIYCTDIVTPMPNVSSSSKEHGVEELQEIISNLKNANGKAENEIVALKEDNDELVRKCFEASQTTTIQENSLRESVEIEIQVFSLTETKSAQTEEAMVSYDLYASSLAENERLVQETNHLEMKATVDSSATATSTIDTASSQNELMVAETTLVTVLLQGHEVACQAEPPQDMSSQYCQSDKIVQVHQSTGMEQPCSEKDQDDLETEVVEMSSPDATDENAEDIKEKIEENTEEIKENTMEIAKENVVENIEEHSVEISEENVEEAEVYAPDEIMIHPMLNDTSELEELQATLDEELVDHVLHSFLRRLEG